MADPNSGLSPVVVRDGRWKPGQRGHKGREPGHAIRIGPRRLLAKIQDDLMRRKIKGGADYDPVVAMAQIANDLTHPVEVRLLAHAKVAKYIHSEMRPTEVNPEDDQSVAESKVLILDAIVEAVQSK